MSEPIKIDSADAAALRQLIMGFRASQMIYVAAKLGVADHLEAGPQPADALANAVGAARRPLYRLLRALASIGVFAETREGAFALTPMGRLLQRKPGSLRSSALLYGDEVFWSAYGQMLHSVQTGEPAFEHAHGAPLFSYLATDQRAASLFHETMREFSDREIAAILGAYDFSSFRHAVDIGGGHGALIAAVLLRIRVCAGPSSTSNQRPMARGASWLTPVSRTERVLWSAVSSTRLRRAATFTCSRACCTTGATTMQHAFCAAAGERYRPTGGFS
jgi:hypothetical protein